VRAHTGPPPSRGACINKVFKTQKPLSLDQIGRRGFVGLGPAEGKEGRGGRGGRGGRREEGGGRREGGGGPAGGEEGGGREGGTRITRSILGPAVQVPQFLLLLTEVTPQLFIHSPVHD
jgi:hypothetical protein